MQVGSWLRGLLRIEIILFKSPFPFSVVGRIISCTRGVPWPWLALCAVGSLVDSDGAQSFQALIVVLF